MKKIVALLIAFVLLFGMVGSAGANPIDIITEIDMMKANNWLATPLMDHAVIDATASDSGIVSVKVYECWDTTTPPQLHVTLDQQYNILPQSHESCSIKITHFVFELTNQYRPNTNLALSSSSTSIPPGTIDIYTIGDQRRQAMNSVISGLTDCLGHEPYRHDGPSAENNWINSYSPNRDPVETKVQSAPTPEPEQKPEPVYQTSTFTTSQREYTVDQQKQTMDATPYIRNNRTFLPVRYVMESMGIASSDITWDNNTRKVGITKDDTHIDLIVGSPVMLVNQKPVRMDVSPEITNSRTMLPVRPVVEALGATIEWDDSSKQATIKIPIKQGD